MSRNEGLLARVSLYCYERGWVEAKPRFLNSFQVGSVRWINTADALLDQNHSGAKDALLQSLLKRSYYEMKPYRNRFIRLLLRFLDEGTREEKQKVILFIDKHWSCFSQDEGVIKALTTASRTHDLYIAAISDIALAKVCGEEKKTINGNLP